MKPIESLIIKLVIWSLVPFLLFVISWWGVASLQIYNVVELSEKFIAIFAISGLVIGIIISLITHKYLFSNFYYISYSYLSVLYFFLSAIGFAFLMGIPLFVIILGVLAGIYVGRRLHVVKSDQKKIIKRVSLFSTLVTGFWVLFSCLLARSDGEVHHLIEDYAGLKRDMLLGPLGIIAIILTTVIFVFIQYYLTNISSKLSYKMRS